MAKAKYLSDRDEERLSTQFARLSKTDISGRTYQEDDQIRYTPDVLFIKLPDDGIDARAGAVLGSAEDCQVCKINDDTGEFEDVDEYTIKVFNPYPVKWYGVTPDDPETGPFIYVKVTREKFGSWICEKPTYEIKVKPNADINAGSSGVCSIFIDGGELASGEDITVHLNWMAGGEKISAGKEAIARYFEDEQKWVFVNAECEDA